MRDASMGYYGSLTYSAADQRAAQRLTSYMLSLNDTDAQQYPTSGAGQTVTMNGLFYMAADRSWLGIITPVPTAALF